MERIEEYILQHRTEFDRDELIDGHFDRFKEKLSVRRVELRKNMWIVYTATAAAAIVIIMVGLTLMWHLGGELMNAKSHFTDQTLPSEINQVDQYYRYRVSQKQRVINNMLRGKMLITKREITNTLSELNKNYNNLRKEMGEFPSTEKATYALTLHYQHQLEVMDKYIAQLQNVQ